MEFTIPVISDKEKKEWGKVTSYLKKRGFELFTAGSTKKALGTIKREPVNIVISDYNLLKINILNFLKKIKSVKPYRHLALTLSVSRMCVCGIF